jgi:predicted transposase YbfD/YdcC
VNAWSSDLGIALGQIPVSEKSNEITAVPKILDLLDVKDATVTIDAMGCQTEIAGRISDRGGDYALAVKENQKGLFGEIDDFFRLSEAENFADVTYEQYETVEKDHGRIETRTYYLAHDLDVISQREKWKNLRGIGMVISSRKERGETSNARRYFITSHGPGELKRFAKSIRAHWAEENNLHWCLDVIFHEDACRKRKDNSAENFAWIRKAALTLLKKETSKKRSIRGKRYAATISVDYLNKVLFRF